MTTTTRTSPAYRVTADGHTRATLTIPLPDGGTRTRRYWAPSDTGYIYDVTDQPGTLGSQVCGELSGGGSTLSAHRGPGGSVAVKIRREVRALVRSLAHDGYVPRTLADWAQEQQDHGLHWYP